MGTLHWGGGGGGPAKPASYIYIHIYIYIYMYIFEFSLDVFFLQLQHGFNLQQVLVSWTYLFFAEISICFFRFFRKPSDIEM